MGIATVIEAMTIFTIDASCESLGGITFDIDRYCWVTTVQTHLII